MSDVTIVQADREAAADLLASIAADHIPVWVAVKEISAGNADDHRFVQAFARHRQASTEDLVEALRAAEKLIDDMSRFVGQMSLRDYALFNEAPIKIRTALNKAGAL